jgi:hypothetical protein
MVKQSYVALAAALLCFGGRALAASDAYDPARLAGAWSGSRTTVPKSSSCSMGKRNNAIPVRLTIEVKPDGTFVGTLAMAPDYHPVSPQWRGQIVADIVEAVVPSTAICNSVRRQYEVHLSGDLAVRNGKQTLGLEGQNAPCPEQKCVFQTSYELHRDE